MRNMPNISRAASLIIIYQREITLGDEMDAGLYAPSECYTHIDRWRARHWRKIRRHIKGITGWKASVVEKEIKARTSARWVYMNMPSCFPPMNVTDRGW